NTKYARTQLARNNQKYEWRLPYQEYFHGEKDNSVFTISDIFNFARTEGNSSRDPNIARKRVKMGDTWLKKNSHARNSTPGEIDFTDYYRMIFYMGEAYSWLKEEEDPEDGVSYLTKSLNCYKSCIACRDNSFQERYMSCIRMSHLLPDSEKIPILLQGAMIDPMRLEAYYYILLIYCRSLDYKNAAEIGKFAPRNREIDRTWL